MNSATETPNEIVLKTFFSSEINGLLSIKKQLLVYLQEVEPNLTLPKVKLAVAEMADINNSQIINLIYWLTMNGIEPAHTVPNSDSSIAAKLFQKISKLTDKQYQKCFIENISVLETVQISKLTLLTSICKKLNYNNFLFVEILDESKGNKELFRYLYNEAFRPSIYNHEIN